MPLGPIHDHRDFAVDDLLERKGETTISVCLPARDEEITVGGIVECIRSSLMERHHLVDEIVVIDDHSTDRTAEVALAAGAKVFAADSVLPEYGEGHGKGEALWKSVRVATGDIIVWCDADILNFGEHFVRGLVGPLLTNPETMFVKGFYHRPTMGIRGGGRVTELVARPVLSLFFPELAEIIQPLAGEFAGRRSVVETIAFVEGYGVDLAILIDIAAQHGAGVLAQVDLDERIDRNRTLDELSPQALAVLQTALRRAGVAAHGAPVLRRPGQDPIEVDIAERPPLTSVPEYRAARS